MKKHVELHAVMMQKPMISGSICLIISPGVCGTKPIIRKKTRLVSGALTKQKTHGLGSKRSPHVFGGNYLRSSIDETGTLFLQGSENINRGRRGVIKEPFFEDGERVSLG